MKSFISAVKCNATEIFHRYIENGVRKEERVRYKPFVGLETRPGQKEMFKSIHGKPLTPRIFESLPDYYSWKRENEGIIEMHGDIQPEYQFLSTQYRGKVPIQWDAMRIINFDIEVRCPKGFPVAENAEWPVTTISCENIVTGELTVFGYKAYTPKTDDVRYYQAKNEEEMLQQFVSWWSHEYPDIITGWYIDGFDVPYLVNRIESQLGKKWVSKLSPVGKIVTRTIKDDYGNETVRYGIDGIASFDYKELYLKFTFDSREQYTLDYISKFELGEGKLDFKAGDAAKTEIVEPDDETRNSPCDRLRKMRTRLLRRNG